jgi:hypothetical protein
VELICLQSIQSHSHRITQPHLYSTQSHDTEVMALSSEDVTQGDILKLLGWGEDRERLEQWLGTDHVQSLWQKFLTDCESTPRQFRRGISEEAIVTKAESIISDQWHQPTRSRPTETAGEGFAWTETEHKVQFIVNLVNCEIQEEGLWYQQGWGSLGSICKIASQVLVCVYPSTSST